MGDLALNGILPRAKFTLRPNFAFRYIGSATARQWASVKLCGMVQGMELRNFRSSSFSTEGATYILRAAITLGVDTHSSLIYFVKLPSVL